MVDRFIALLSKYYDTLKVQTSSIENSRVHNVWKVDVMIMSTKYEDTSIIGMLIGTTWEANTNENKAEQHKH